MSPTTCPVCEPRRGPRASEAGLTLLEVVVATAIFAVTVTSLLLVRERAIDQTASAKNHRIARRLSMLLLEEIHGGKSYEEGESGAFDAEAYPGFFWHMKQIEIMELKESELPFLQQRQEEPARPGGAGDQGAAAPGGGALAAMLGAGGEGLGDELRRCVVEIAYPARTDTGDKRFEVVTYYLKEADPEALAKALGGGGGADSAAGLGGLSGAGSR